MDLEPLKQWICDTCGQKIEKPEDGYVQFRRNEDGLYDDIIIVHHKIASPLLASQKDGCYQYNMDTNLQNFLGVNGLNRLLSFFDLGPHIDEHFEPNVVNVRKFVDVIRRLHTPYYEEAKQYWFEADSDGYFQGANEHWPYMQSILMELIDKYKK